MSEPYLSVVAIVKDEEPYIEEWIAFHQVVGVERFYLYDNGCTDDTVRISRRIPGVAWIDWPGPRQQMAAYQHALSQCFGRWLAFIDVDEFLFSPTYEPLPSILRLYEDHDAVGVCWSVYGTSQVPVLQPNALGAYLFRARKADPINRHIKSIVQRHRVDPRIPRDPHHFLCSTVDENWQPIDGPLVERASWSRLRINHYVSKSIQEANAKMLKPRADNGELRGMDLTTHHFNLERDEVLVPYVPLVEAALEREYR